MRRLLVRLYPRDWRDEFGDGFAALLEESELTPGLVIDCVRGAALAQSRAHRMTAALVGAMVWLAISEVVALRTGLTVNVLWPPSSSARALGLLATLLPPAVLTTWARSTLASP